MTATATSYRSSTYWRVTMCNMLLFFAFQLLLPTIPLYLAGIGSDKSTIGMMTAIITFSAVFIRLFTGYALDHYNRRAIVIGGSILFALAASAFPFSTEITWTVLSGVLLGIGWGVMTASYATIVSGLIPPGRQGAGIGTFMIFAMVSMAIGPFVGAWIYHAYGSTAMFATACAIALMSLGVFLGRSPDHQNMPTDGADDGADTDDKKPEAIDARGNGRDVAGGDADGENPRSDGTRTPDRIRGFGIFEKTSLFPALLIFLFTLCYGGIISFAALYGHELGLQNGGIFFLLSSALSIAVRPIAGKLFDSKGHAWVLLPGIVVGIGAFFVLSNAAGPATFLLAAGLYGLSFGSVQPYLLAWTIQRAEAHRQGAANSTFLIGMDSGIAFGSIVLGVISETRGYAMVFGLSSLILAVQLTVLVFDLVRSRQTPKRHTGDAAPS